MGHDGDLAWLSGDITLARTPELRRYLMTELNIQEVTWETILSKLDTSFLQAQSDGWVLTLYESLNGQPALRPRLDDLPLIRIEDGTHVSARANGQPRAFLPSAIETGFPTVHRAVCATGDAREFLQSLGLTEPDPVDVVVSNVLPKYHKTIVETGADGHQVLRIRNPARRAAKFEFRGGVWRVEAERDSFNDEE